MRIKWRIYLRDFFRGFFMSFAGNLTQLLRSRHAKNFDEATKNPVKAQFDKLISIVSKNENTEFGKKHGFWKVHSVEEYQKMCLFVIMII